MKIEKTTDQPADDLLKDGRTTLFKMTGNSMYPVLKDGDVGMVQKCNPENLRIGDIVVFKLGEKFVAHRLINIQQNGALTFYSARGDKNLFNDPPFTVETLSGQIIQFTRGKKILTTRDKNVRLLTKLTGTFRSLLIPIFDLRFRLKAYAKRLSESYGSLNANLKIIGKPAKKPLVTNTVLSIIQGVAPFLLIVCIKLLVDRLTNPNSQSLPWMSQNGLIILTAAVFLLSGVLSVIHGYFFEKLSHTVTNHTYQLLHQKHTELDLSYYEDPNQQDKIHRAVQEAGFRPVKIMGELLTLFKSTAAVLVMLVMFLGIKWYLLVLLLISVIPSVLVRLKYTNKRYRLKESISPKERQMAYFNRILTGFPFAKELRLFGFSSIFLNRFRDIEDELYEEKQRLQKSEMMADIAAQVFAVLLIFTSLATVVYLMTIGAITIGSVVLFFFVFQRGYSVLSDLLRSVTLLMEDNTFLNDFFAFLNLPIREKSTQNKQLQPLHKGITVENVRFRYETSKRDALSDVSLFIPAGKTVAFVGANGSGKTTLIKLLSGFYAPLQGSIRYDNDELNDLDKQALRRQITAVFQDFALYNISAHENISLGNIHEPFNLEKAKEAAKAAGIAELFERLPLGYETLLGNLFKSGEELSIGQWQKIAIARAFYRDSPILFMDEPSSALDVDSEKQLLGSLRTLAKDKTVVIISHRLSTVQWADILYVLDRGTVVESGNHEELMAKKGKYYAMYMTSKGEDIS
jgi:ATP-binding cassette, subfamily B, bacterial